MNHCNNEKMPSWARRVDDYGKRRWHTDKPSGNRIGNYIGNIIFNLIFLWVVNKIPDWHLNFIRENYMVVLWILNANILLQIGGNILKLLSSIRIIHYLANIIIESASFVTQMVLYYIYPFDFTNFHGLSWLDWFIPIALIVGMVVSVIKVFSNLWKLIFWRS